MGIKRYAAHRLRIGNRILLSPYIELQSGTPLHVALFEEELERTIFLSGTIVLYHPNYVVDRDIEDDACAQISLENLLMEITPILSAMDVELPSL